MDNMEEVVGYGSVPETQKAMSEQRRHRARYAAEHLRAAHIRCDALSELLR